MHRCFRKQRHIKRDSYGCPHFPLTVHLVNCSVYIQEVGNMVDQGMDVRRDGCGLDHPFEI